MSVHTTTITRKGLAIATAGLFALSSLSFTPFAVAQDGAGAVNSGLVSQLSKTETAKLTIHKLKGGFVGTNQYGVQQDVAGTPLKGIAFDIYRVKEGGADIDLSTIEGWQKYSELDPTKANEYASEANYVKTITTGDGGVATDELPIGVYVIKEDLAKSNPDPAGTYTPAAPFITALPFTNEGGTAWNKDVHVYPKNQEVKSTKEVDDRQGDQNEDIRQAGQTISYTLKGGVPPVPNTVAQDNKYFDRYELIDTYDSDKWTPDTSTVKVQINEGDTKLADLEAADFEVTNPDSNTFTIKLTDAGLLKLRHNVGEKTNVQVVATIDGTLKADLKPGTVKNGVEVETGNSGQPTVKTPKSEVESKYGRIDVTKFAKEGDKETNLAGAKFELHKCTNANAAGQPGTLIEKSKQTVGGKSEWETDAEGKITITGIQLEDWFDGKGQADSFDYCLLETKAPEGYELLPQPILTPVNTNTPETKIGEENLPFTLVQRVENVPTTTSTFKLPSTGEWGRWWLVLGGVAAVLAALGVLYRNNRRTNA